ncbi:MAG: hypothetical protein Q9165_002541 [Trypethelium subeluteriae]
MFLLGAVAGTPIGQDGNSVVVPTTARLSDTTSTDLAKPVVPKSAVNLSSDGLKQERDLAVRDNKTTLSRRDNNDDWQSCQETAWQVINVGQCYGQNGGLPASALKIQYDCPTAPPKLPFPPVAYTDLAPRAGETRFADHHPLEEPNGDLMARDEHVEKPKYDLISSRGDSDLLGDDGPNSEGADALSSRDIAIYSIVLFNDVDRSISDPGCSTEPVISADPLAGDGLPENECIHVGHTITSGMFTSSEGEPDRCAIVYPDISCQYADTAWIVQGDMLCHRGPQGWAFVISSTCNATGYGP